MLLMPMTLSRLQTYKWRVPTTSTFLGKYLCQQHYPHKMSMYWRLVPVALSMPIELSKWLVPIALSCSFITIILFKLQSATKVIIFLIFILIIWSIVKKIILIYTHTCTHYYLNSFCNMWIDSKVSSQFYNMCYIYVNDCNCHSSVFYLAILL